MGLDLSAFPQIVFRQATAPTAIQGRFWIDTDDGKMYYYSGSAWISMTPRAGNPNIHEINTSVDMDTTSTGTTTASMELTAVSADDLGDANYLEISSLGVARASCYDNGGPQCQLQIEIKEIGGAYGDTYPTQYIIYNNFNQQYTSDIRTCLPHKWLHTLSAGEKTNGIQVKLTMTTTAAAGDATSYTNKQVILSSFQ